MPWAPAREGPSYLLQFPLLVLPEGKVQQLVVPRHLQVHVLPGKGGLSRAEGCPPAAGHSEPLSQGAETVCVAENSTIVIFFFPEEKLKRKWVFIALGEFMGRTRESFP